LVSLRLPLTRTPASTPFPYTTLFRSEHARHRHLARQAELALLPVVDLRVRPDQPIDLSALADWQGSQQVPAVCAVGAAEAKLELDRKSTRLNSSHRTISYAVFCLKKK